VRRRLAPLVIALAASPVAALAASPAPPAVDGRAYMVVGRLDGRVLAAREAGARRPIASITKLMTVIVALEHLGLDDVVTIPAAAVRIGESTARLEAGERLTVRELVAATLVPSAPPPPPQTPGEGHPTRSPT
jgi:D-alanyl-D-alanine carboxypeptidase